MLYGSINGETPDRRKQNLEGLISKKEEIETALANNIPEVKLEQSLKSVNSVTFRILYPKRMYWYD
jgi:hypothetical protein